MPRDVCKWFDLCPMKRYRALGLLDERWVARYCESDGDWERCVRYQLEERGESHPDWMLPDGTLDLRLRGR
jgi:hypothetical protein